MSGAPVLLVNPPSPPGATVNREGFGGLGVVLPGRRFGLWPRGFVYPAHFLAEAAGMLESLGRPYCAGDCVLAPVRGPAAVFGRLPETSAGNPVLVRAAAAALEHDLAWTARHFARGEAPVLLAGTAFERLGGQVAAALPRAVASGAPTGFEAARRLLGLDPDPGPPDAWPFASWDRLPLGKGRRLPLFHGRGCVHACTWCPYVIATGRLHLVRSAERTAEEFAWQARRHRPRRFVFRDPVFGLDRPSSLDLLGRLAGLPAKHRAPFEIETRPETLDPPMSEALARAGCVEIKLGVETLEPAALVATRRIAEAGEAEEYRRRVTAVLRDAAERRFAVRLYLLRGLPGSTPAGDLASEAAFHGHPAVTVRPFVPPVPAREADRIPGSR